MERDSYINQSISRAIKVLEALCQEKGEAGISELSRKVGLHKSVVHRILVTLEENEWVEKDENSGKYRLGLGILSIRSSLMRHPLIAVSRPIMMKLLELTDETIVLAVENKIGAICIEKLETPRSVKLTSEVGRYFPLHAGATGIAILIGMPEERIKSHLFSKPLERYTERTWTDPHKVLERVLKLKELGYATITGEVDEGATAIAVPLVIRYGEIYGSLTIGMPEYRFSEEKEREFVPLLFKAAKEITEALDASCI